MLSQLTAVPAPAPLSVVAALTTTLTAALIGGSESTYAKSTAVLGATHHGAESVSTKHSPFVTVPAPTERRQSVPARLRVGAGVDG